MAARLTAGVRSSATPADAHGNTTTGDAAAVARYDHAVDRLLRLRPEAVPAALALRADEPGMPMAQALVAYLLLSSTDRADVDGARDAVAALDRLAPRLGDREEAHRRALAAWAAGDWRGARRALDALLAAGPLDLLAHMLAHQLDFFLGDAAALRDRPLRTLAAGEAGGALGPAHPHHALVRGMAAFGLEESGDHAAALEHGSAAVERNPDDAWAVHAVAHVHEMRGDLDAGLRFLGERRADWEGALLGVHVAWHEALYLLDAGRPADALAAYDRRIHHAGSQGVPLEMLDASALLWRLRLDGVDAGDRWARLADAWAARAAAEPWYAFNDAHAVMALAGAGRLAEARAWLDRLAARAPVGADVALPAARALVAYAEGRPGDAVDDLLAVRGRLHRFGGSHAQRDAWERTLLDAALADGRLELAAALLDERLAARPASRYARARREELSRRRAR